MPHAIHGTVVRLIDATKAKVAATSILIPGLGAVLVNWVSTGAFDAMETRGVIATFLAAVIAGVSTYRADAGRAVVVPDE